MVIFPLIVYYMSETKTHKEKNKKVLEVNFITYKLTNSINKTLLSIILFWSTKYQQTTFNNTLKVSYTMIQWDLFQQCKDGSTLTNKCDIPY